jgi:carbon starvation protein CstA
MIVLWTITVALAQRKTFYWITLLPALLMTTVTSTYLLFAPEGFSLSREIAYTAGGIITATALAVFGVYLKRNS